MQLPVTLCSLPSVCTVVFQGPAAEALKQFSFSGVGSITPTEMKEYAGRTFCVLQEPRLAQLVCMKKPDIFSPALPPLIADVAKITRAQAISLQQCLAALSAAQPTTGNGGAAQSKAAAQGGRYTAFRDKQGSIYLRFEHSLS